MHETKVKKVQEAILKSSLKLSLDHHNSNTLRDGHYKNNLSTVDLSNFNTILNIDREKLIAHVEPSITVSELCKETLKYGLIPEVVPEFSTITVGGAIMGAALESTSHNMGQFSDSCEEYELILGDGSHVFASKNKESELFYGISGSYGTLALLVSAKIRLRHAKPYVSLNYTYFSTLPDFLQFFQNNKTYDFLDGVALSDHRFVGIKGYFSDSCENLRLQSHYFSNWYIAHIEEKSPRHESMKLWEYLFRFDKGAFWMGYYILSLPLILSHLFKNSFKVIKKTSAKVPFIYRLLFGPLFSSKKLYKIWHKVPIGIKENIFLIQDFYTPLHQIEQFLAYLKEHIGIYPLWFCPIKGTLTPQILSPHYGHNELLMNIGVYGIPKKNDAIPHLTRELEKKIASIGGKKMLYSLTYYDEKSFSEIYQGERYQKLREKFHALNAFPSLYNKVIHGTENI